jgi:hypothetical protein
MDAALKQREDATAFLQDDLIAVLGGRGMDVVVH